MHYATHIPDFLWCSWVPRQKLSCPFSLQPCSCLPEKFPVPLPKKKHHSGLKTSVLCMDEQHSIRVIVCYALPPNLVTPQLSLEVALSPIPAMSSYSQASPWQYPPHLPVKRGSAGILNPIKPRSTSAPRDSTQSSMQPTLDAFVWPLEKKFF